MADSGVDAGARRARLWGLLASGVAAVVVWVALGGVGLGVASSGAGVGVLLTSVVALLCTPLVLVLAVLAAALPRRGGPGAAAVRGVLTALGCAVPPVLIALLVA